jgi:hypothetical protein
MIFTSGMYDYNNNKIPCEIIILQIYDRNNYYIIEVFKKRMLNVIIISLQSVNEWPVFNLKKTY